MNKVQSSGFHYFVTFSSNSTELFDRRIYFIFHVSLHPDSRIRIGSSLSCKTVLIYTIRDIFPLWMYIRDVKCQSGDYFEDIEIYLKCCYVLVERIVLRIYFLSWLYLTQCTVWSWLFGTLSIDCSFSNRCGATIKGFMSALYKTCFYDVFMCRWAAIDGCRWSLIYLFSCIVNKHMTVDNSLTNRCDLFTAYEIFSISLVKFNF